MQSSLIFKNLNKLFFFIAVFSLTACTNRHVIVDKITIQDNSGVLLDEAAESVDKNLNRLYNVTHTKPTIYRQNDSSLAAQYGFAKMLTIDWNGPVESLLLRLSNTLHFRFKIFGNVPASPLLVNLSKNGVTIEDTLRNIQVQLKDAANIQVYLKEKVIQIVYLNKSYHQTN